MMHVVWQGLHSIAFSVTELEYSMCNLSQLEELMDSYVADLWKQWRVDISIFQCIECLHEHTIDLMPVRVNKHGEPSHPRREALSCINAGKAAGKNDGLLKC